MRIMNKQLLCFSLVGLIIVLDQISKWFALERILRPAIEGEAAQSFSFLEWLLSAPEKLPFERIEVLPFFNWVMVWNRGISFGLLQTDSPYGPVLMIALALVITAIFVVWAFRTDRMILVVAFAMVIGGALGNVIDRIRFGAVADFLDFHAFGFHWPAFNLADSMICIGIALALLDGLLLDPEGRKGKNSRKGREDEQQA